MRRWQHAGLLVAMVVVWAAGSLAQAPSKSDGHDLLRKCTTGLRALDAQQWDGSTMTDFGWCMGYLLGFVEGYSIVGAAIRATQPGATMKDDFCPTGLELPVEQLARVLVEWLRTHPALLDMPRTALTIAAFAETFPCPSSVAPPQEPPPSVVPRPSAPKAGKGKQR
jgi:Rap1a immunity proteins